MPRRSFEKLDSGATSPAEQRPDRADEAGNEGAADENGGEPEFDRQRARFPFRFLIHLTGMPSPVNVGNSGIRPISEDRNHCMTCDKTYDTSHLS